MHSLQLVSCLHLVFITLKVKFSTLQVLGLTPKVQSITGLAVSTYKSLFHCFFNFLCVNLEGLG